MPAYQSLQDKADEIMAEMNYKGWFKILTEGYGAILKLPFCEIDLE